MQRALRSLGLQRERRRFLQKNPTRSDREKSHRRSKGDKLAFPACPVGSVMQISHCEAISHIDILFGFAPHRIAVHEWDRVA